MPEPLLFPAFLYGELSPTQRKMKAEAKKWGKRYAKSGDFPEPKLIPVPPGSIVFGDRMALDLLKWGGSTEKDPEWEKVCLRAGRQVLRWIEGIRIENIRGGLKAIELNAHALD